MPILASTTYVNAYGKSSVIAVEALSSTAASFDVFIVKYNTLGKAEWSARIGGISSDIGYGIRSDGSGNVYVIGRCGIGDIYNSDGTLFDVIQSAGSNDAFIVKYNSKGIGQWAANIGSTGSDAGVSLAVDSSGNVYVTGGGGNAVITAFNSDKTAFGTTLANDGAGDVFIVKYNASGFVQWAARIGGPASDIGYGIATDSSGNVYVTGQNTSGGLSIYNAGGTPSGSMSSAGSGMCFIVKYNTNGILQWAARVDSSEFELGYAIATDPSGNVYITGQGGGTAASPITAYNANGTAFSPTYTPASNDAFVVKYDTNGSVQWFTRLSSNTTDIGYSIAVDSSGNAYVSGYFGSTLTAFNANGTAFGTTIVGTGNSDAFVCKYNTSGAVQWLAHISSSANDIANGISVDSSGNAYVTGLCNGVTTIRNAGGTTFGTLPSTESLDAFVAKYNTNGAVQWITRISSASGSDIGNAISSDALGNVYVTGQFAGEKTSFYGQAISIFTTVPNAGSTDAFIVKYNTNGNPQWVTRIASTGFDLGYAVANDPTGNVYVTGQYNGDVTAFNSDATAFPTTLAHSGGGDVFLVKYNSSGVVQWVARLISSGSVETSYAIASDSSGNVYITGQHNGTLTAVSSNGVLFSPTLAHAGGGDVFVAKYDTNGIVQWLARMESGANSDIGYGIATDSNGDVYVTGQGVSLNVYNSTGTLFANLANSGSNDAFVVKYNTSGSVQWIARVGSAGSDVGFAIATDSSNNIYVTGQSGTNAVITAFNANATAFGTTLPSSLGNDVFVVKYNSSGSVQWVARIGGDGANVGYGVATDPTGNVYVTGQTGNGATVTAFSSNGQAFRTQIFAAGPDGFIVKYNSAGIVQWTTRISTNDLDVMYAIDTDSFGNVYVTGIPNSATTIATIFNQDRNIFGYITGSAFIVKYDTNGFGQWAQATRSATTFTNNRGISVDTTGNSHVVGGYSSGALQIYNIDNTVYKVISSVNALQAGFIVKYSNNTTPLWVAIITALSNVFAFSVATDSSGNVYVVGQVNNATSNTLTIYNSSGTIFGTLTPQSSDAFVVKYNTDGMVQWATRIGSTALDIGYGVSVDSSGNAYVIGQGGSGVTITAFNSDGTSFSPAIANSGSNDAFIVKYNTTGFVQWFARIASTASDTGYGLSTDSTGNVYAIGYGGGVTTAFNSNNGTAFSQTLADSGSGDIFLVKYNTSGTVQWVTRLGSSLADEGYAVATDPSGNVYVTGYGGAGNLTVYNSNTGTFETLLNSGNNDVFVVKYDTGGMALWAARIASTANDFGQAIATDSSGNVYVTGRYGATATVFNANGTSFSPTLAFTGVFCGFVVKYNTNGVVQWATRLVSTSGSIIGNAIKTDSAGNVYVAGQGPDGEVLTAYNADGTLFGSLTLAVGSRSFSGFVAKYNTNGVVQWLSIVNGSGIDIASGMDIDSSSNLYVAGRFIGSSLITYST